MPRADNVKSRRAAIRGERDRIHKSVVSVFRGARQDADLTQERAAELLGWSKDVIVNLENDRRDLGVADLILFADKVKMEPADLFARIIFFVRGNR